MRAIFLIVYLVALATWLNYMVQPFSEPIRLRHSNARMIAVLGVFGHLLNEGYNIFTLKLDSLDDSDAVRATELKDDFQGNKFEWLQSVEDRKNVILLQLESIDAIITDALVNDEKVMPNLHRIANESISFSNAFDQTYKYTTCDGEFMALTSLFPIEETPVYGNYNLDHVESLPRILNRHGYYTFSIHGYNSIFWGRHIALPSLGYDDSFFIEDLDQSDVLGWGISDKSIIKQAVDRIVDTEAPFFSHVILLTHHTPFNYVEEGPIEEPACHVEEYVNSARYVDESIALLFDLLDEENKLNNTAVLIFSDHNSHMLQGLHRYYEVEFEDNIADRRIPFLFYTGEHSKEVEILVGQIDVAPLILQYLGIEIPEAMMGGKYIEGEDALVFKNNVFLRRGFDGSLEFDQRDFDASLITKKVIMDSLK